MADRSDLERRCADLEELLNRERAARRLAQDEAKANATALRVLAREVRAPLESALEWSQMLRRELLSAKGRDHALRVVERQVHGSMNLIDDLVATTAGHLPRPASIQVDEALEAAHAAVAPRLQLRKLACTLELQPTTAHADRARLERLLRRLLETAGDLAVENTELRLVLDAERVVCEFDAPPDLPALPPSTWDAVAPVDAPARPQLVGLFLLRRAAEAQGGWLELRRGERASLELTLPTPTVRSLKRESSFADHALRTPLQVLSIGVELLRTRVRDSADHIPRDWVLERLDSLEQAVDHLSAAVERLSASEPQEPAPAPSAAPSP